MPLDNGITDTERVQLEAVKSAAMVVINHAQLIVAACSELGSDRIDGFDYKTVAEKLGYTPRAKSFIVTKQKTNIQSKVNDMRKAVLDLVTAVKPLDPSIT